MRKISCAVEGCSREGQLRRGWCSMHYSRWRSSGEVGAPGPIKTIARSIREAFDLRTSWDDGGCLVWIGERNFGGYGAQQFRGRKWMTHRIAWTLVNGEIPEGMEVNHKCWNRACVNVDHLNLATRSENKAYRSGPQSNSTSGVRNVYWNKLRGYWYVSVETPEKNHTKSGFKSPEEAAEYAEQLRQELFGEFAGNG